MIPIGCCGAKKPSNMEYETLFKDGTAARFATAAEAHAAAKADGTADPAGKRRAATVRAVLRKTV